MILQISQLIAKWFNRPMIMIEFGYGWKVRLVWQTGDVLYVKVYGDVFILKADGGCKCMGQRITFNRWIAWNKLAENMFTGEKQK